MHPVSILVAIALGLSGPTWLQHFVPDRVRTPGAIDLGMKQDSIAETICVLRYTKTVRPLRITRLGSSGNRCASLG